MVSGTINGIPCTVNSDGSFVLGVGTAASTWEQYSLVESLLLQKGSYKLSCKNVLPTSVYLSLVNHDNNDSGIVSLGNGSTTIETTFTLTSDTHIKVYCGIGTGANISSSITVYPMIRPASIQDNTYVPYAMTNRELTKVVSPTEDYDLLRNDDTGFVEVYRAGRLVTLNIYGCSVQKDTAGYTSIITLPAKYCPITTIRFPGLDHSVSGNAQNTAVWCVVHSTGTVSVYLFSDKLSTIVDFTITYISRDIQ